MRAAKYAFAALAAALLVAWAAVCAGVLWMPLAVIFVLSAILAFLTSEEVGLLQAAQMLVGAPFAAAYVLAPFLALTLAFRRLAMLAFLPALPFGWPVQSLGPRVLAWMTVGAGAYVAAIALREVLWMEAGWKLRIWRQIRGLPVSKAASASLGLGEFQGVARGDRPDKPLVYFQTGPKGYSESRLEPFYLEDSTGRILVDPRGAVFRGRSISLWGMRFQEMVLTRHVVRHSSEFDLREELWDGDPIYVLGSVQVGADGSRFIGLHDAVEDRNPWWNFRWGKMLKTIQVKRRDASRAFFLSDTDEPLAARLVLKGIADSVVRGVVWLAAGVSLMAFELPRTTPGFDRWTVDEVVAWAPPDQVEPELWRRFWDKAGPDREAAMQALGRGIENDHQRALRIVDAIAAHNDEADGLASGLLWWLPRGDIARPMNWNGVLAPSDYLQPRAGAIVVLSKNANRGVRQWAVLVLGQIPSAVDVAIPALIDALHDADPAIRGTAIQALHNHGVNAKAAVPALREALARERDEKNRKSIDWALAKIEGRSYW